MHANMYIHALNTIGLGLSQVTRSGWGAKRIAWYATK
jgi:hypothetical protein